MKVICFSGIDETFVTMKIQKWLNSNKFNKIISTNVIFNNNSEEVECYIFYYEVI